MDEKLRQDLRNLSLSIDHQTEAVIDEAERMNISPYKLRGPDGSYILLPLLLAKAQTLNGLAVLSRK